MRVRCIEIDPKTFFIFEIFKIMFKFWCSQNLTSLKWVPVWVDKATCEILLERIQFLLTFFWKFPPSPSWNKIKKNNNEVHLYSAYSICSKRFDIQLLPRQTKFHSETISTSREVYSVELPVRRVNTRIRTILSLSDNTGTQTRLGERGKLQ